MQKIVGFLVVSIVALASSAVAQKNFNWVEGTEFQETPLHMAVQSLQTGTGAYNCVFHPEVDREQLVTLRLTNLPRGVALTYVFDQAGYDWKKEGRTLHVLPPHTGEMGDREPLENEQTGRFVNTARAREIIFDSVEFDEAPLRDVVDYIHLRSVESSADGRGVNVIISRRIDAEMPVSFSLRNVPVSAVLLSISQTTGIELRLEEHAVFFDPPGTRAMQLARLETKRLEWEKANKPQVNRMHRKRRYNIGTDPKDPRSPAHPDYVHSTHQDVSKRTNALNNVYKWVNGKWTFVRYGSKGSGSAIDDWEASGGLRTSTLGEKRKVGQ